MKRMSLSLSRLVPHGGRALAVVLLSGLLAVAAGLGLVNAARGASTLPTLALTVTHSSITVGAAPQSGAVNVVSTASGIKEAGIILAWLKPGVTPEELYAFLKTKGAGDANSANKFGAIVFDAELTNGKTREAQTTLQPGTYVALLNEGEGAPTVHASFTVAASKAPAALPAPQATVKSIEFGFRGPATLKRGELVRFENEGFLVHMDFAIPVKSRSAGQRLVRFLKTGNEKAAGKLFAGPPVGFSGPVSSGAYQQETITAKPGWYVQACFMDTQDKRSHTLLGMERLIRIVK
jgi:hypothetical protein